MKECPSCKAKNRNDAVFCAECGANIKDVPVAADEWATGTGAEKVQKAMEDAEKRREAAKAARVSAGWGSDVEVQAGRNSSRGGTWDMFVDQSESVVSAIGNNYLQNYLLGGSVKKGVGILTQKRFYYKGQNFSGEGKAMKHTTEEGVVSIEDITFTMFSHVRHIGLLIFSVILLLVSLVGFAMPRNGYMIVYPCWVAAAVSLIMFFINRQTVFQVSFPGGSFGFDIRYYPIADIRDFQRQLHLLKDQRKDG